MGKKGFSAVVGTVLLIALVIVAGSIVWVYVNNLVTDELEGAESCFNIFEKVRLNTEYICIEDTNLKFSIGLGDIEVDEIIVAVYGETETKNFKIPGGVGVSPPNLPGKNSGVTYTAELDGLAGVFSIKIIPTVGGTQCEVADSFTGIENC